MKLYPVFANIENRLAVIAGGGKVALRKAKDLLESGARVKIISPEIHEEIKEQLNSYPDLIKIIRRKYKKGDLKGAFLVFAATGDSEVNKAIFAEAEAQNILINAVDDPDNCSFYVPSMIRKGDLVAAISTSGASPAMSAKLRSAFEKRLPENIENILSSLREARMILKNMENLTQTERGEILKKIVNDDKSIEELGYCKDRKDIENMIVKRIIL
jgi:precorrin-2 dehydrogenase / sirohydrochlorin ferrochelatase